MKELVAFGGINDQSFLYCLDLVCFSQKGPSALGFPRTWSRNTGQNHPVGGDP